MFVVKTPASDRALLTIDEIKAALEITGDADDAALTALGLQISDRIARECLVPASRGVPPTLLKETITETWRLDRPREKLIAARHPIISVASVMEWGVLVDPVEYEFDSGPGILERVDGRRWSGPVVVEYDAGYAEPPGDLKLAAAEALREQSSSSSRDPLIKKEKVYGIGETEYLAGGGDGRNGSSFSPEVASMLDPYRYMAL